MTTKLIATKTTKVTPLDGSQRFRLKKDTVVEASKLMSGVVILTSVENPETHAVANVVASRRAFDVLDDTDECENDAE